MPSGEIDQPQGNRFAPAETRAACGGGEAHGPAVPQAGEQVAGRRPCGRAATDSPGARPARFTAWGTVLVLVALWSFGCSRPLSEADRLSAKAVVERALASDSYDEFLASFTAEDRARMHDSQVWIRWWQKKVAKNRAEWRIVDVRGGGWGKVEVVAENRERTGVLQSYRLVREGTSWRISEIESKRE